MNNILLFENNCSKSDYCKNEAYHAFIDYAFAESDYFMLVYVNYNQKGYSKFSKEVKSLLNPFKVKCRTNPYWPGTMGTFALNTKYKIIFYKNDERAKAILKLVDCISDWSRPFNPEDLAFFKKNSCWFYSVGHEKISAIINPTEKDKLFLKSKNIPFFTSKISLESYDYYKQFDEQLE